MGKSEAAGDSMRMRVLTISGDVVSTDAVPGAAQPTDAEARDHLERVVGEPCLRLIAHDGARLHPRAALARGGAIEDPPLLIIPGRPGGPLKDMSAKGGASAEASAPAVVAAAVRRWQRVRAEKVGLTPKPVDDASIAAAVAGSARVARRTNAFLRLLISDDLLQVFDDVLNERKESAAEGDYDAALERLAPVPADQLQNLTEMGFDEGSAKRALWLAHMDVPRALNLLLEGGGDRPLTEEEYKTARRHLRSCRQRDAPVSEWRGGPTPDAVLVSVLQDMGFAEERARWALRRSINDFERALMSLVSDALRQSDGRIQQLADVLEASLDEAQLNGDRARSVLVDILRDPQSCGRLMADPEVGGFLRALERRLAQSN